MPATKVKRMLCQNLGRIVSLDRSNLGCAGGRRRAAGDATMIVLVSDRTSRSLLRASKDHVEDAMKEEETNSRSCRGHEFS